jgi:DNA-binding winged helix-turn-helix (wHTH) protein
VQSAVKRLRQKLREVNADVVIDAVRGVGFRLRVLPHLSRGLSGRRGGAVGRAAASA